MSGRVTGRHRRAIDGRYNRFALLLFRSVQSINYCVLMMVPPRAMHECAVAGTEAGDDIGVEQGQPRP